MDHCRIHTLHVCCTVVDHARRGEGYHKPGVVFKTFTRRHDDTRGVSVTVVRLGGDMLRHVAAELRFPPNAEQNMGMPIEQPRRWSVEEVWTLPDDGNRYETVDGELRVTPAPRLLHQHVLGEIYAELRSWLRGPGEELGMVLMAPTDVILDLHTLVQPDLVVLPPVERGVMFGEQPAPEPFRLSLAPIWEEIDA